MDFSMFGINPNYCKKCNVAKVLCLQVLYDSAHIQASSMYIMIIRPCFLRKESTGLSNFVNFHGLDFVLE